MSNDDPFTLDLFNTTMLSSGLGLTAFGDEPVDALPSVPAALLPPATTEAAAPTRGGTTTVRGRNFFLAGDRGLAKGWKPRAQENLAAIRLAAEIEAEGRPATSEEQARLIRFTGFGASELANAVFRRPGEAGFRSGWDDVCLTARAAGKRVVVADVDTHHHSTMGWKSPEIAAAFEESERFFAEKWRPA